MAIDLHIHIDRGDNNRLTGTVRALADGVDRPFSGTLELLRVFEDLLDTDPAAAAAAAVAPDPAEPADEPGQPRRGVA